MKLFFLPQHVHLMKGVYLFLCLLIPYFYSIEAYHLASYSLYTYMGLAFYQADHFNIRFLIGMVAVEEMVTLFASDIIVIFTRMIFHVEDFSIEIILGYAVQALGALIMCLLIINRGAVVSSFKKHTNSKRRYRLIGMEWLLLLAYLSIVVLHVIFFSYALTSIIDVTGVESYMAWYDLENIKVYLANYDHFYLLVCGFQLFAIQSYNYKRCKKEWFLAL